MDPIKIYYAYADQDESFRKELEKHLILLHRRKIITSWHHRMITPGVEVKREVDLNLGRANIILLLVSPDFLASDYCYGEDMQHALKMHKTGNAVVIPVILRPVYWEDAPFHKLQALPLNGKPITTWPGRHGLDEAFMEVALGIRAAINAMLEGWGRDTTAEPLNKSDFHISLVHAYRASLFNTQQRYKEALAIYEEAIRLNPDSAIAYSGKGDVLWKLERYEEALAAFERAIRLDPNDPAAYGGKGDVLWQFGRHEEALAAFERAISLDPNDVSIYYHRGDALLSSSI